jgi:ribonucleoside-diphosphate reductase alpha chain
MVELTKNGDLEDLYRSYISKSRYARWVPEEARRETWSETVGRYIYFWIQRGQLDEKTGEELYEAIRQHEVMPSMRALMTAGQALDRDNVAGFNPVTGDTRVVTKEFGTLPITHLVGGSATVLNKDGRWVDAEFRGYGTQPIYKVITKLNSNTVKETTCTANHRWIKQDGAVVATTDLVKGDWIDFVSAPKPEIDADYNLGIMHGLVYGDGTTAKSCGRVKGYVIRLCGEDNRELLQYFEGYPVTYPPSANGDPVVQMYDDFAATHALKDLPSHEETDSYLLGFVRGWLAADGSVTKGSQVSLCVADEGLAWLNRNAERLGFTIQRTHKQAAETNYGKRKLGSWVVFFSRSSMVFDDFLCSWKRANFEPLSSRWVVSSVEEAGYEDSVYCAEVDDTNTFVLEGGLLTGNCSYREVSGSGETLEVLTDDMKDHGIDEPFAINISQPISFDEIMYILLCGTGVGFSAERQVVASLPVVGQKLPRKIYAREEANFPGVPKDELSTISRKTNRIHVADSKYGWASALRILIVELYNGNFDIDWDMSKIRPAGTPLKTFGGRACLTGDTVVYRSGKKSRGYLEMTINDLVKLKDTSGHFNRIKLRSVNEETGELYYNNLVDVIDNGVAPVYEVVTEHGYRIKATGNHRFMDQDGEWKHLDQFNIGEDIAVNGSERKTGKCCDCDTAISRRAKRCKPCQDVNQQSDDASDIAARQRKENVEYRKSYCEHCGTEDARFEVHHIDHDPHNNDHSNLLNLCSKCHQELHARERTFGDGFAHRYMSWDKIISISYVGDERVYDLSMEAPDHNFIANGFVSHNSGPEPLDDLFNYSVNTFRAANGRRLSSIEVHGMVCKIAEIVVVGGVRRSALISLSNLSDDRMRHAKSGQWWESHPEYALANNSVSYTEKPDAETYLREWLALVESKSGERGIFNREASVKQAARNGRRDTNHAFGTNPCSEIILRDRQFCNLSEVVIRSGDSFEDLRRKVRLATILGTLQSTLTDFRYLSPKWTENTKEERLLGVSLTGIMDHQVMSGGDDYGWGMDLPDTLKQLKEVSIETNAEWADKLGIKTSAAITCVKPSGTVSQLVDSASGIHPRYSPYYIRTVRADKKDPLAKVMEKNGFPCEDDVMKPDTTLVFSFPQKAPEDAVFRNDRTALEQLEHWLLYQRHWCEHKPSVTVYVKDEEWMEVGAWVYEHFDEISGISFLPHSDHSYRQAPYQEIDEDEYYRWLDKMPKEIDWSELAEFEASDHTEGMQEYACVGNKCELT